MKLVLLTDQNLKVSIKNSIFQILHRHKLRDSKEITLGIIKFFRKKMKVKKMVKLLIQAEFNNILHKFQGQCIKVDMVLELSLQEMHK